MANTKDKKVLIRIENLKQYFPLKKSGMFQKEKLYVRANDDVSLEIYEGETLGLVGESGCGKSTLGRTLLQLYEQTDGRTIYYGRSIDEIAPKYILETYKNLSSLYKKLQELRKQEEETLKEYDSKPEGNEKYLALEKYREAEKAARNLFLDLAQLVGGLLVAEDLDNISKVLLDHYKTSVEVAKLRRSIHDEKVDLEGIKLQLAERGKSEKEIENETSKEREKIKSLEGQLI